MPPEEEEPDAGAQAAPSAGDFGHTMVYSPDRTRAGARGRRADRRQALLVGEGRRNVLSGSRVVVGRSREARSCWPDPNVSRRHAEVRRRRRRWVILDLGSTNGIKVNGRRVDRAQLEPGDQITLGLTELTFELD